MEKTILTPRLELNLIQSDDDATLQDLHVLRVDPDACSWSIYGTSKSLEDTQKILQFMLPISKKDGDLHQFSASYLVRERAKPDVAGKPSERPAPIGQLGLRGCVEYGVPFPDNLTLPDSVATRDSVLKREIGYMFARQGWGKGYCSEAVAAVLQAYQNAPSFWAPYRGVWVSAVTGATNVQSQRVLEKSGFKLLGMHYWDGEKVFLGGDWQPPEVMVWAKYLVLPDPKH